MRNKISFKFNSQQDDWNDYNILNLYYKLNAYVPASQQPHEPG